MKKSIIASASVMKKVLFLKKSAVCAVLKIGRKLVLCYTEA